MRNKTKLFLIPLVIFVFGFLLAGNVLADQCIRGYCQATCGSNEEPSTSPGDTCSDSYNTCCVPKSCPDSSLLGCISSSSCGTPTAGGSCSQNGYTCCDVAKAQDNCSSGVCMLGSACMSLGAGICANSKNVCCLDNGGSTCASSPDGTICKMTDGTEGACKSGVCAQATYYDPCVGALKEGVACTTASGATGTCKSKVCTKDSSSKNSNPTSSGTGWNSSELGSFGLPGTALKDIIVGVLDWLLTIIGILAIIAFVIAGIQYYLVATDEKMLETAKKTMRAAIIGLIVALSGFIVIRAVDAMLNVQTLF